MKKRKICLFFCVLVFVQAFLFLPGCSKKDSRDSRDPRDSGDSKDSFSGENAVAMGRFMEERIELPIPVKVRFDLRCGEDGTIRILFENEPGSLYLYESNEEGTEWKERKLGMDWLPKNYRVGAACVDAEGNILACVGEMSKDPMAQKHASGTYRYFRLDKTGKAKEILLEFPAPKEEYPVSAYGLSKPALSEDGKLYGMLDLTEENGKRMGRLFCFDVKSGKKLWSTDVDDTEMKLFENQLYVYDADKDMLKHMDTKTGKELEETECSYHLDLIDIKQEKNRIYCIDEMGIYGTNFQMESKELLVDGALGCFSGENYSFDGLVCVSDDVFLLSLMNMTGEKELFRYQYDSDVPTHPDNELVVYSLKDNQTMKTLVSDFRKEHPEVYVRYDVGMRGSNAKNVSDAINALNTEIMGGNGPDVLALNNLPWKSYGEKGILTDLGGCYEKNEVFENLFQPYEKDGIFCAVPVVFKIPVAAGDKSVVTRVHSLEDLLKEVEATRKDYLPFIMGRQDLVRYMSSFYWQTVQAGDGSLSRKNLKRLLEMIKKIQEHVDASTSEWTDLEFTLDDDRTVDRFDTDFVLESDDMAAMSLTYLTGTDSLADMYNRGDLYDGNLSWQAVSEGTFSPLLVGIGQKSERMDIAEEFLRFCLSEEEQKSFGSSEKHISVMGFPVNKKAWESMEKKPSKSELKNLGGRDSYVWPPQEAFAELEQQIKALKTPAMEDTIVIDTILDSIKPYMAGEKNLDTAVDEIMQKLELYYAE